MPDDPMNDNALLRVIHQLEEHGLGRYDYQLYDYIDPEVLEIVANNGNSSVQISFPVKEYEVILFGDGTLRVQEIDDS